MYEEDEVMSASPHVSAEAVSDTVEEEEEPRGWDIDAAYANELALRNDRFTYKPHRLNELHRKCIPESHRRDRHQTFVDEHGRTWQLVNPHQVNEINVGDLTDESQEASLGGQLYFSKQFGVDEDYPAIQEVIASGWDSRSRLIFKWVTPISAGYLLDFLSRDERALQQPGAEKLLASRCLVIILTTVQRLYHHHGLALATFDVHAIGLSSDFQSGFLRDYNLHHLGSVYSTVGYPYYQGKLIKLGVADSFLAGVIAFSYIVTPNVFALEKSIQDQLEVEQQLSPFEFLEHVLDNPHWPAAEAKLFAELKELVITPGSESLEIPARRH
jgi:hypothetical protein